MGALERKLEFRQKLESGLERFVLKRRMTADLSPLLVPMSPASVVGVSTLQIRSIIRKSFSQNLSFVKYLLNIIIADSSLENSALTLALVPMNNQTYIDVLMKCAEHKEWLFWHNVAHWTVREKLHKTLSLRNDRVWEREREIWIFQLWTTTNGLNRRCVCQWFK